MSSTLHETHDSEFHRWRIGACIGVICLSILVPAVIVVWSIVSANSGKTFGCYAAEETDYTGGAVKNGELWIDTHRVTLSWPHSSWAERRLKRLDVATGIKHETGFVVTGDSCQPVWMNEQLYVYTETAVFKAVGTSMELLAKTPPASTTFWSNLFVYEDQLTLVCETLGGTYRLTHLVDGSWIDGPIILLPGPGRVWTYDAEREDDSLLPLTCAQPNLPTKPRTEMFIQVIPQGPKFHVLFSEFNRFSAYRIGFDFGHDPNQECSALAPDNFRQEVSGWEPVESASNSLRAYRMACDQEGPIFSPWTGTSSCSRRLSDGHWITLIEESDLRRTARVVLADPTDSTAYLVGPQSGMYDTRFQRIDQNRIGQVLLTKTGSMTGYSARWKHLAGGILLAWFSHLAIAASGAIWRRNRTSPNIYHFGNQQATIASSGRRALALSMDLLIALIVAGLLLKAIGVVWPTSGDSWSLLSVELGISEMLRSPFNTSLGLALPLAAKDFLPDLNQNWHCVIALTIAMSLLFLIRVLQERRSGTTPGKWLLGIRTIHSTLRPCGMARTLLRNLFLAIDFPFLLTPLPAVVSMMLSQQHRRLGDRVAGTVVIESNSVRKI